MDHVRRPGIHLGYIASPVRTWYIGLFTEHFSGVFIGRIRIHLSGTTYLPVHRSSCLEAQINGPGARACRCQTVALRLETLKTSNYTEPEYMEETQRQVPCILVLVSKMADTEKTHVLGSFRNAIQCFLLALPQDVNSKTCLQRDGILYLSVGSAVVEHSHTKEFRPVNIETCTSTEHALAA